MRSHRSFTLESAGAAAAAGFRQQASEALQRAEAQMGPNDTFASDTARAAFDAAMREHDELQIRATVAAAQLDTAYADDLIAQRVTLEHARSLVMERLANHDNATPTIQHLSVGGESPRLRLMVEALAARFGGPKPSNAAREFIHMRVVDMARQCLEDRGAPTRLMSPAQLVQRALHTTSDFPQLLEGVGQRFLSQGYNSYQGGVRRICRESTAPDFRAKQRLRLGEAPELLKVGQGGEVTRGTMAEAKESYLLETFARIFGITRQALINDDLGAFGAMTIKLGRAASEFVAGKLATLLTSNPTLADAVALFHATHGNLGTAGVISTATLGEGMKLMRLQKGLDNKTPIDVTPKYLTVPAALEVVARQNVALINATKVSDVNPFTADLEVVVDPRMDAVSATAWYLAADQAAVDTIEYSYLEAEPGPQIEMREGFEVEGVEFKVRLDFGAGVLDHRGLFKNAGA